MPNIITIKGSDDTDSIVTILVKNGYKVWTKKAKYHEDYPQLKITVTNGKNNPMDVFYEKEE